MDLYSEIILDYYKNPRNKGDLKEATMTVTEHNPLCGDIIILQIKLDSKNKITDIKFSGEGCAISQAATSMLTEKLLGKNIKEIKKISNEDVYEMLGIPISPGRVKCALLGLSAARNTLNYI